MSVAAFAIRLDGEPRPLVHHWQHCLGSGHATLALRADWQRQLERCHRELGVKHVRFHGLLSDDVGTLVEVEDKPLFSFHNADLIMDFLGTIGMSPLVELSFMPKALASGDRSVFHYRANVTPPKDPLRWTELIGRLVGHWHRRYGRDALLPWMFEVWNEPNLPSFWSGRREEYFDLYERTAHAIKAVSPELRVGGPATAKTDWLPEFIDFCERRGAPCDFVSTHYYPTDALGSQATDTVSQLAGSDRRAIGEQASRVRSVVFGRPLYLTEWSITSNPRDPMHDEPIAAAYAVKAAMEMAPAIDGSSWWTFSDVFEENYFPSQPFHGGFGLLTLHGIAKPSFRAFQLLGELGDRQLPVTGAHETVDCWATRSRRRLTVLLTNLILPRHAGGPVSVRLTVAAASRPTQVTVRRIDEEHANPRREWSELGKPESLDPRQVDRLHAASALRDEEVAWSWQDGSLEIPLAMPANGVAAVVCEFDEAEAPAMEEAASGSRGAAASDETLLDHLQRESYSFFIHHTDQLTGLVRDSSAIDSPMSIAATGLALACYPIAVERGFLARSDAARLAAAALRFMLDAPQGPSQDATGHHGFYYHFLDPVSGRRTWDCELSTIDSALLAAGGLLAAEYFTADQAVERGIRDAAAEMLARMDWRWALAGGDAVCHGWHPVKGFLPHRWVGYCEALLLYALALGAPSHALDPEHYRAWTRTYAWKSVYGLDYLYAGPLFIHQLSHCWIDFRGIRDEPMRAHGLDYFENSRRATLAQQRYAIENPLGFHGYGAESWGITACEGPGPATLTVDGVERTFFAYQARGAPFGPDDGTLAPWAVIASLPFAPEIVLPTIRGFDRLRLRERVPHGFPTTLNPSFPDGPAGWRSTWHYGLNQGPIVLMLDNHRHGLPWRLMQGCRPLVSGLQRAGFSGGWLDERRA